MLRQPTILLFICFFFGLRTKAQLYPFVNYTPRDGLIGNQVGFITQDSKGKLYFGTTHGLSIYDGSRFTNYSTENGLASDVVNGVLETGDDSVFVVLNSHNLQYIHNGKVRNVFLKDSLCPVINQFIRCSDGQYYAIADEGLFRFEKDHFANIPLQGLTDINADKNLSHVTEIDSFLVINEEIFNPAYRTPKRFIVYNYHTGNVFADTLLPDVYYSVRTPQNELLLGTAKGVFVLDRLALKRGKLELLPPRSYSIPPNTSTGRMFVDNQQNLWMNTAKGILKASSDGSNKFFSKENGLVEEVASCIFQDREGIMWFGSDIAGAMKLVDQNLEFYKEFKPGFFAYDVNIPKGTDSVWMYDQAHHRLLLHYHQVVNEFPIIGKDVLNGIVMGKKRYYGLGAHTIYRLNPASNNSFTTSPLYTNSVAKELFNVLLTDKNENPIIIGTSITVVLPEHKIIREPFNYFVDKAVLTRDDFLFVVTRAKSIYIYKIDPSNPDNYLRLVKNYDLQSENIEPRSIDVDSSGRVWVGTRRQGLVCYTFVKGELKFARQLTARNGLTDNFVKYVYCDSRGNVWASTPTGLDKVSFENNGVQIENVTKASNMYLDIWKTDGDTEGVIWGIAATGLVKVYPADKPSNPIKPEIILSKFSVNNQEQPFQQQEFKLKYFQNNLFFQVAVPSFFDEKKTLFSYKLDAEGKPGTWTEPALSPDISFLNLSHGHYDLKIRAIFLNGKYVPLETAYSFTILTPWWQTRWFLGIEFLSILGVITIFFRLYYRNKLHKQMIGLEKKQAIEKERTRIATDMHDDMGAGLSRIKVLSERIKFENQKGIIDPAHLQKISSYSEEMMEKMGEIVWALNQRNDSVDDLLGYTRAYATDYLTTHDIRCIFHAPTEHPEIFASGEMRRNIFLSVKEVLHNVVKHAEASTVDITITISKDLCILIHDNGKGINLENTRRFGNGLNNIKKRMVEIGGFVKFKNENGTSVLLQVSLDDLRKY
jgi:ligand-binding sensor domain-containing protein